MSGAIGIAMPPPSPDADVTPARPLAGRTIMVTRPAAQAGFLLDAIGTGGGVALTLPTIDIAALGDAEAGQLDAALRALDEFDLLVFVSANAALQAAERARHLGVDLATARCAAAPGPATAACLREIGVRHVVCPTGRFDSEGLLAALDEERLMPRRVLVLRGTDDGRPPAAGDGREWLGDRLRERGATVTVRACYRRMRAVWPAGRRAALLSGPVPDAVVVTSSEGGAALFELLGDGGRTWLRGCPIFVPHERIAARMAALGCDTVLPTAGGDAGVLEALLDHFGTAPR